jgi:dTDP-4-amino-4,6-dideoxygalactose transaminase
VGAKFTEHEKNVVLNAMNTEDTLTQGKFQKEFESDFSKYIGVNHSFATSCAASALELAAILLKLNPGDEVICPAHTYNASAYPFAKHGGSLVWADINANTWVVDVENIELVVTKKTRAIVVVHLYGAPVNMPEIMNYAKRNNLIVIEDCAQAIGATIGGKPVGSFGDISVFSFHSHKNISTLGEGGMICTNNEYYAKVIPGLRHNGHVSYLDRDPRYYWKPAMSNVDVDIEGVWPNNFCIGEVQCALGASMIPRINEINDLRRLRFNNFKERTSYISQIKLQELYPNAKSTHHLLPIIFRGNFVNRDTIIEKLAYEYGIQAIVQYYPLNRYPLFYKNGYGEAIVPNTDELFDNMISLPFHHWLVDEDFEYMTDSFIKCLKSYDN